MRFFRSIKKFFPSTQVFYKGPEDCCNPVQSVKCCTNTVPVLIQDLIDIGTKSNCYWLFSFPTESEVSAALTLWIPGPAVLTIVEGEMDDEGLLPTDPVTAMFDGEAVDSLIVCCTSPLGSSNQKPFCDCTKMQEVVTIGDVQAIGASTFNYLIVQLSFLPGGTLFLSIRITADIYSLPPETLIRDLVTSDDNDFEGSLVGAIYYIAYPEDVMPTPGPGDDENDSGKIPL